MCVCWVCFWTNTFPTLLWRKKTCVKIQVKMLQFPSWTYWNMQEQQKPPYVGPLEDTQYYQVDDFGKSISNPLVFSAPAQAPKGTLTNTRDGEVFVLRPKHWSSNMMYVWSLVKYLPGVTKFRQLKMIQNAWPPFIQYNIFQACPLPIMLLKEDAILNFLRSFFMLLLLGARRPILPSSHVSNVSSYRNLTSPANTKL